MQKKSCRKCGSLDLNCEGFLLNDKERYVHDYRHLQNRKIYKCRNCGTISDFEESDH
jgi:hypothetical protein